MFTQITYQDYLSSSDRYALIQKAISRYVASGEFIRALEAEDYFRGENVTVSRKTVLRARKLETTDRMGRRRTRSEMQSVVGNRIASGFLNRFVTQQSQYLLGNGVTLPTEEMKTRLGPGFDRALERIGEKALLHGVCYGYWNCDHIEVLESARDGLSGFFLLADEMTGEGRVGIHFIQLSPRRPMFVRLFEEDGVTLLKNEGKGLSVVEAKKPYVSLVSESGETVLGGGYGRLPIVPFYANEEKQSELTMAIRSKIDAYDRILSDFADNLDRANDIYWVLNNFGGTLDDVAELLEEINRVKAVANLSDGMGGGATAEPHTIEVPYAARCAALELLKKELYRDWMALDLDEITGGSLTNVAIRMAMANFDLKADRFEWQAAAFVRGVLGLLGMDTEDIRFNRTRIANESETVADIQRMRGDIDRRMALQLNPYIQIDEVEKLMEREAG